ncbi:MAG: hypothetical protein V1701_11460 [Planctomycetota bacterium]
MRLHKLYIITAFIGLIFSLVPPIYPDNPTPFYGLEWKDIKTKYQRLYQSASAQDRCEAIKIINDLNARFLVSPDEYAFEAMEFLCRSLPKEQDATALNNMQKCLAGFSAKPYVSWLSDNYKKIVTSAVAKIRFFEVLPLIINDKNEAEIMQIAIDLFKNPGEPGLKEAFRNSIIKLLSHASPDSLMNFIDNDEPVITKAALKCLGESAAGWEKLPELIPLLKKQIDEFVRIELVHALEKISGQKLGAEFLPWQDWWKSNPPMPDTALKTCIDRAIERAAKYLLGVYESKDNRAAAISIGQDSELLFYTLIKSQIEIPEPLNEAFINVMLNKNPEKTYNVALMAIVLTELDREKYSDKLIECAKFLMANQTSFGAWSYGDSKAINNVIIVAADAAAQDKNDPLPIKKFRVKTPYKRLSVSQCDNSNTQYALLGLRSCAEAGIEIPAVVWSDAEKYLQRTQNDDGGWCYTIKGNESYGSMSIGGLGALAICKHYQGKQTANDPCIKKALNWVIENFDVSRNPNKGPHHYYYLYGMERAGILLPTEFFGKYEWYPAGARYLMENQGTDGSWYGGIAAINSVKNPHAASITNSINIVDTCFAVLFLCRATKFGKWPPDDTKTKKVPSDSKKVLTTPDKKK